MVVAVPVEGMLTFKIVKDGFNVSSITIFVAPGFEILAARSANSSSSSDSSGVKTT